MWLAFYNPQALGDVLLLTVGPLDRDKAQVESKGQVTLIRDEKSQTVKAINLFNVAEDLNLEGQGQVNLSDDQVAKINDLIQAAGFDTQIESDNSPKFVVGYVEECRPHEDSDHLSVTQTNVGDESLQIVCGAANIDQGLKVIVAKPGAVMPSGKIIWPGQLRNVDSMGMICSTRELGLTQIEDLPGIWELDDSFEPGTPLEQVVAAYQK